MSSFCGRNFRRFSKALQNRCRSKHRLLRPPVNRREHRFDTPMARPGGPQTEFWTPEVTSTGMEIDTPAEQFRAARLQENLGSAWQELEQSRSDKAHLTGEVQIRTT
ncbi:hypothetical protein R1flu_014250 [Riccia fluitans]|uniref:Uncharacterized protein n=1 Tax=Riccia fluitans TaxID=41844 RepID=A0ABD1YGN3_9MARC